MDRYFSNFSVVTRWLWLLMFSGLLAACGGEGDSFLDKNIDAGPQAKTIIATELVIGGRVDNITLSPGQETSIAVRVTYEDGSMVYLDPEGVTFEFERNQPMMAKSGALGDASSGEPVDAPFVIDGFLLKVPTNMDESVAVTAVYQETRTQAVLVEVHDKVIEHLQLTPAEHRLVKGAKALFHLDAFYVDGSSARLSTDVLSGEWRVSNAAVVQVNDGNGWFEALSAGQAVVTYELNGIRSNDVAIAVSGEMVTAIDITPTQLEIAKGATGDVRAMATLSDGSKLDITSSVSWNEQSAISVNHLGAVMGVTEQAKVPLIAAFSGVQSAPALVTVKGADISALVLSPMNMTVTLAEQGRSLSLVAQYTDGSALPYSDVAGVVYTLDNDIAHIDVNGDIHPKSEGVAVVNAKTQDRHGNWVESNSVAISVVASPLVGITLHADSTLVPQGVFTTLRAMGEYVDGRVEDISSQVSWQSSAPSVLTVADGIAYGASQGEVTVSAYLGGVLSDDISIQVTDAKLTGLSAHFVLPKAGADGVVMLPVGLHGQAQALASFSDGGVHVVTNQVAWHSGDDAVVSVDPDGVFTGLAKGETNGYASFSAGGITLNSGKGNIKVTDATPVRLDILPSQVSLVKGLKAELHAVATYSDGHVADVTSATGLSWTTQNASIATLSHQTSTQVQGAGAGDTAVKATWGELEAQALVSVEEKTLTGIALNPVTQTLAKGSKASLQVLGFYSDNTQQDITSSVSDYRSSDNRIAIVDTSGEVSALAPGSVTLTVSFGDFESAAQLVVPEAKVSAIRIGGAASIVAGTTQSLTATAVFDDGSELDITSAAHWQSSANSVVVNAGSVWAKDGSEPSVTITATFDGQQAQHALSITSATLSSLTLTPNSAHIVEGATQVFTLEATYSDNAKVDVSTQATWTSSNNTIAGFAPNTATLAASASGDVTVTATFGGMSAQSVVYIADKTAAVESLRVTPATLTLPEGGTSSIKVEANYSTDPSVFVDVTAQTAWQLDTDFAVIGEGMVVARKARGTPMTATAIYGGKQATLTLTITDTVVERLQLTPASITLAKGYSTSLMANAFFSNGLVTQPALADIAWSVESGEGVTITNGLVTATEAGKTATIKATYQGQSAIAVITTNSATLDSVLLTDINDTPLLHSMLLAKGVSVEGKVLGKLSDGNMVNLDQSKVTYTITGDAVTQSGGTFSADKEGLSDIAATYTINGQAFTSQVVTMAVSSAEVASIAITSGDVTLVKGMTHTPQAQATLTDGTTIDITPNATWTEADDTVAKFDATHTLKGLTAGQTSFTASFSGKTATANVSVTDTTLTHLTVSPQITTVTAGQTQDFVATAHFNNGTSHELDSEVSWSVSNANATIDSDGELTAISAGNTTVTATLTSNPSQQMQASVTIVERSIQSVNVTLDKSSIASGQSTTATASVMYTDNTSEDITSQAGWLSSDSDVALVTGGYIRGLTSGSADIQATFRGETSTAKTLTVSSATVSSVQLTPASITLAKGYDAQLTLTATYSDNSTAEINPASITWSVDSGEGVTVTHGVVTATEAGKTATIKATYQGQSATATVTTSGATIDSIALLDVATDAPLVSTTLPIGSTHTMKVVANLSDGSVQALTSGVTYHTSDDTVASIASDGTITALKQGVTAITASYTSGANTFTSNVTLINVTGANVKSIAIVPNFNPIAYRIAGLEYDLDVQATLTDNTTVNITSLVTWQLSDGDIAGITNATRGTLEAKKGGETDITAHYAGFSDTLTVKVMDARLTSLEVTPSAQSLNVGTTKQYQAIAHYSNNTSVDVTDQVSWSATPSSVATIDASTGLATAVSTGSATITATKGSTSTSVPLTVTDKPVQSIQISASSTSLPEGQNAPLTAVVTYTDGTQETNRAQDVLWVSSEPLTGAVKNGQFYALTKGDTDLTATFRGKTSNTLTMTITDAALSGLTLTPATANVAAGQTQHYTLMGTYTNGQQYDVTSQATWSVTAKDGSATTIASMATKGEANTNSAGEVKVTATIGALSAEAELTISNKTMDKVMLNQGQDIVLNKGDTLSPVVSVIYSDNTSDTIVSADSNLTFHTTTGTPTIAEFDTTTKGQLNTPNEGKTQAWVTYQSGADTLTSEKVDVVVTGKALRSLAFTQTPPALPKGTQGSFVLEATYTDGTTAVVTDNATWTSSDTDKATVLKGVVTASNTNTGDSTITASYEGQSVTHTVTVSGATLTHVTLNTNALQLHQGLTQTLTLTAHYSDGSTQNQTANANWSSTDTSIATVSQGTVTGVAEGNTTVTATLNGETASADVFVVGRSVNRIEIQVGAMSINKGVSTTFNVYAYYEGDTTTAVNVTNQAEISVDTNVAYVTNGQIYGYAQGTTSLDAAFKGKQATQVTGFTVTDKAITSLQLTPATQTLPKGESSTYTLTAIYTDRTTEVIDNANATWSIEPDSSTGTVPTSVTVSQGTVTAQENSGAATVKATYQGIEVTATVTPTNATLESVVLMDVSKGAPLKPVTLHDGQSMYFLAVHGLYSDGSNAALTTGVTYKVDGDAITVANIGGWGMYVDSNRTSNASQVYAEYDDNGQTLSTAKVPVTVTGAQVTSLDIVPNFDASQDLMKGASYSLKAMATLDDGSSVEVTSLVNWQSSDNSIGEMSSVTKGQLDTKDDGGITITASYSTYSDTLSVNVADVTLQSIIVTPNNHSMDVGTHKRYTATGHYDNSATLDITNQVSWSSSDAAKATTTSQGDVTAVAPGTVTIHASKDGVDGQTGLTVNTVDEVQSVHIELNLAHSLAVGESAPLNAQIYFKNSANNDYDAGKRVTWKVADPSIGYILDGVWYARAVGDTKIWATYGGITSNEEFAHVNAATVTSLTMKPSSKVELAKGRTYQLAVEATYTNGGTVTQTDAANWSTTDNTVVSVTQEGLVSAVGNGTDTTATITASFGGKTASVEVEVQASEVDTLELNHPSIVFSKGENQLLSAHWLHSDGSTDPIDLTDSGFSFHTDESSIASFDATTKNLLIANSTGFALVWVEYTDGTNSYESDKVQVWVQAPKVKELRFIQFFDSLPEGAQGQFRVSARYSDNSNVDVTSSAQWVSTQDVVATVDTGLVRALSAGHTDISATFGGQTIQRTITIEQETLDFTTLTMRPNDLRLTIGATEQVVVSGYGSNGNAITPSSITWATGTGDESIIKVSNSGLVEAVAPGTTTVEATVTSGSSSQTLTAPVTVSTASITGMVVSPMSVILPQGAKQQMNALALYDAAPPQDITTDTDLVWSVDDDTVATIDPATGILTGVLTDPSNATTKVKATWSARNGQTYEKTADVSVSQAAITQLLITPSDIKLGIRQRVPITASAVYENGSTVDVSSQVIWHVDPAGAVSVVTDASLNQAQVVSTSNWGTASIWAELGSITSASVNVEVRGITAMKVEPLNNASVTSVAKGTSVLLAAYAQYNNHGGNWELLSGALNWTSANDTHATVDSNGLVTGVAPTSSVTITATEPVSGEVADFQLEVTDAEPVSMFIDTSGLGDLPSTTNQDLLVYYTMTDGTTYQVPMSDQTWTESSSGLHATVLPSAGNYVVQGATEGDTTLTVTSSNASSHWQSATANQASVSVKVVPHILWVGSHADLYENDGVTAPEADFLHFEVLGVASGGYYPGRFDVTSSLGYQPRLEISNHAPTAISGTLKVRAWPARLGEAEMAISDQDTSARITYHARMGQTEVMWDSRDGRCTVNGTAGSGRDCPAHPFIHKWDTQNTHPSSIHLERSLTDGQPIAGSICLFTVSHTTAHFDISNRDGTTLLSGSDIDPTVTTAGEVWLSQRFTLELPYYVRTDSLLGDYGFPELRVETTQHNNIVEAYYTQYDPVSGSFPPQSFACDMYLPDAGTAGEDYQHTIRLSLPEPQDLVFVDSLY